MPTTKRYGVTNTSTDGFAWYSDDLTAARHCARSIGGWVIDLYATSAAGALVRAS